MSHKETAHAENIVEIRDLRMSYDREAVLDGVSLSVGCGESVALVGESGAGKSTLLRAIAGLSAPAAFREDGTILFEGRDPISLSRAQRRRLHGNAVAFLFQNGPDSFDPLFTIGSQFDEAMKVQGLRPDKDHQIKLLKRMGVDDPVHVLRSLASELSGGLCQRAALAVALAGSPALLLADEPTSALDRENRDNVGALLKGLNAEEGLTIITVTHDIAFAAEVADRIAVMYKGRIVEEGPVPRILSKPQNAYTETLLASIPRMERTYKAVKP